MLLAVHVVQVIVGIGLLTLGALMVLGRERIVANHRRRVTGGAVQPATAWLVLGAILSLAGVIEVLVAVT
jgi:hypothetical protein